MQSLPLILHDSRGRKTPWKNTKQERDRRGPCSSGKSTIFFFVNHSFLLSVRSYSPLHLHSHTCSLSFDSLLRVVFWKENYKELKKRFLEGEVFIPERQFNYDNVVENYFSDIKGNL